MQLRCLGAWSSRVAFVASSLLVACGAEPEGGGSQLGSASAGMASANQAGATSAASGAAPMAAGGSGSSGARAAGSTAGAATGGAAGSAGDGSAGAASAGAGVGGTEASCSAGDCLPPAFAVLNIDYQVQETGYWCGPAATRVALSAWGAAPSQQALAQELGTTTNGTDWIGQVTQVLNEHLGAGTYATTEMPNDPPSSAQRERLWNDIVRSVQAGYVVVANIVAPASNHPPGYPSSTIYHYFAVAGYDASARKVYIADSANFGGNQQYWLTFDQLATLIPPKGYAALR